MPDGEVRIGTSRTALKVFLATSGDLDAEREAVRQAVERLNQTVRRYKPYSFELYEWTDVAASAGRPQSLINPSVESCDLFIGVLWDSWGTSTGQYSSGFEEEYELAKASRERKGSPEIAIYFKAPDVRQVGDPGKQLEKVLEFRNRLKAHREVLYETITPESWFGQISQRLLTFMLDVESQSSGSSQSVPVQTAAQVASQEAPGTFGDVDLGQLSGLLSRVQDAVEAASKISGVSAGLWHLDRADALRLHLAGTAEAYRQSLAELLGAHQMNAIFELRERFNLTPAEDWLVLCSLISGYSLGVTPGWWWFRQDNVEVGLSVAALGPDSTVRPAAFALLTKVNIGPSAKTPAALNILQSALRSTDQQTKTAALRWFGATAKKSDLTTMAQIMNSTEGDPLTRADTRDAVLLVLARTNPRKALRELGKLDQAPDQRVISSLVEHAEKLGISSLRAMLRHPQTWARWLAFSALSRKGRLSVAQIAAGLGDGDATVRRLAVQEVANTGATKLLDAALATDTGPSSSDGRELTVDLLGLRPYETLRQEVDWNNHDVYEALAVHYFSQFSERVRQDLKVGVGRWRQQFIAKINALGPAAADVVERWEGIADFVNMRLICAALAGLARNGGPADAALARSFLSHSEAPVQAASVQVLARVGRPKDGELLLKRIGSLAASVQSEAAHVAIALVSTRKDSRASARLKQLLYSDIPEVRLDAVRALVSRLTPRQLEALLDAYQAKRPYYYNVVVAIDRVLFAPKSLNSY